VFRKLVVSLAVAVAFVGSLSLPAASAVTVRATFSSTGTPTFRPKRTDVAVGTRVVWKSAQGTHTVTAYGGNWTKNVTLSQGETTARTFRSRGTFKFYCHIHGSVVNGVCSGMCGKIVVG